ncbi:hypothetical protein A2W24_01630 [Microgenomates group bacterium RBG_16_45_19]|nr:MAG: hypothetical protein A2W24_01630 [Microgenomates group bacterium RBG_16_45_19]
MLQLLSSGSVKTDRRVQIKMPKLVVEELDRLFPDTDRSRLLTQLALEAILTKLRFTNRPGLGVIASSEQAGLDTLWDYLEEREHGNPRR